MSNLCTIIDKITGCEVRGDIVASKDPKARYSRIRISLYDSFTDKEFHLAGSLLAVASITGGGTCKIRLDYVHAEQINLREVQSIKSIFKKIYISSDGGGGIVYLYICQAMETVISPDITTLFTGTVINFSKNTQDYVRRVTETGWHYKARNLTIRNTSTFHDAEVGYVPFMGDLPERADFLTWSFRVLPKAVLHLWDVDILGVGFCSASTGDSATLKMIGTLV